MKLYCNECGALHTFTAGEVERIVYALQAAEADARCADNGPDRNDSGIDPMVSIDCLSNVLEQWASHAYELYGEHVDAWVEARRTAVREADHA